MSLPIAIIGAGLSGLSCAQAMAHAGHSVQLFDKSRGPSGRMSTRRSEDDLSSWQCDHGAQYFTARDAAFRNEVRRWQAAGAAALWDARLVSFDGQTWGTPKTPLERFVGAPRMTSPATWLVQNLGERVQTQWQTTVQALTRDDAGWALSSAEHGQLAARYRAVLLAMPAPQAEQLLRDVAPAGSAVAGSASMRACWAVMVRGPTPVPLTWEGAFVNAGPLRWVARDRSKPGRTGSDTWLLHASAEWSKAHLEDDAATVTAALLAAFAELGGPDPAQVKATAHRWRYADTEPALNLGCWWDREAQLGMCGDWLNGGKVEGAWLSGRALAQQASAIPAV